jgi:hypothetical protein
MTTTPFVPPQKVLDELGITEPGDIQVEAIAQHLGATVIYEPLTGCEARLIGFKDRAIITINEASSRERQRFSIGHELGHWMRDRGNVAFSCSDAQFGREWSDENPEKRANRYAADLLLPRGMFKERAWEKPVTFDSVRTLAGEFQTSITATAIRLVEFGGLPSIILYSEGKTRSWFIRGKNVPEITWPLQKIQKGTAAFDLHEGKSVSSGPQDLNASLWIDDREASDFEVREHSIKISSTGVLTLLWWKQERQILALTRRAEQAERSNRY